MQSHLTRRVFYAILNNEPVCSSKCRSRLLHTVSAYRTRKFAPQSPHHLQRRNLFAFNTPSTLSAQSSTLPSETGLKAMKDLMYSLSDKCRSPPNNVLVRAFRDFFSARIENPGVITQFQARLLIITLKHLKAQAEQGELEHDEWQAVFSMENLENVLFVLSGAKYPLKNRQEVLKVAYLAFQELCVDHGLNTEISVPALVAYVNLMSLNGNPKRARFAARAFWWKLHECKSLSWFAVMKGFAMIGDRRELRKAVEELETRGGKFDTESHQALTETLIEHDLFDATKAMYECPISDNMEPSFSTKETVVRSAILKNDIAWARPIFDSISQDLSPRTRDIILLWEAAHGKGAAEIAGTVTAWTAENPEMKSTLSISCVNNLIELANSLRNPQLASEYAALSSHWGLMPDTQTQLLQLKSRIQARDIDGAVDGLRGIPDFNEVALANLPLMNQLIQMFCLSDQKDALFEQTSSIVDPLFENGVHFESDTVAALTHMLIYRHDMEAVSELLRPILGFYDTKQKDKIRSSITGFILDGRQESDKVWEAYEFLNIAFPETDVSMRTSIMSSFFERERSDLACLVFGHMRQAENVSRRPKPDTYARCFQGISKARDTQNLELVHNMLKLDLEVSPTTMVLNGLMLAYAACDMPEKSMEIFRRILQTHEGPTHETIHLFFKACENHHNGTQEAMKMMRKIKRLEIGVNRPLYTAFIEALAAQCEFDLAADAVAKMESETGHAPTRDTIGFFYNSIPYQYWKDKVEQWAKDKYPDLWDQLKAVKRSEHEEGLVFDGIVNEIVI